MHIRKPLAEELPSLRTLFISLLGAIVVLAVLTFTVILPAERGFDPSGIGAKLDLTRMGQLKAALASDDAPRDGRPSRQDQMSVAVFPGQGKEVKMEMLKGYKASYSWTATGPLYHDTHGDIYADPEVYLSYSVEESVSSDSGDITALYGGFHGWYWLNRSNKIVTIELVTEGEYIGVGEK